MKSTPRTRWWQIVDWQLVLLVALPFWALVVGLTVYVSAKKRPAAMMSQPSEPGRIADSASTSSSRPAVETAPMPRQIVIRYTEPVFVAVPVEPVVFTIPIVVPVPVQTQPPAPAPAVLADKEPPVAPPEPVFQLPDTERMPADVCKTYGTKVRFRPGLTEAMQEAKGSKKMLFVLHISGHFDDPGFT